MKQKIYMVAGVPGSGKSWVCNQLRLQYNYLPHDAYIGSENAYSEALIKESEESRKPILADCPFAERKLKEQLEKAGRTVIPVFIVEAPAVIKERYETRGKPVPKAHLTRAVSILERAKEWAAIYGTSAEVLAELKRLRE